LIARISIILYCLSCILFCACDRQTAQVSDHTLNANSKQWIARVHGRSLLLEDVQLKIPTDLSDEDSIQYIRHYANRWLRKQVLLKEAEKNMDPAVDLERLIQDYRESLISQSYESKVVADQLNTTVRPIEIQNYYDAHQQDFALDEPMLQGIFLKLKGPRSDYKDIQKQWSLHSDSISTKTIDQDNIIINYQQGGRWKLVSEWLNHTPASVLDRAGVRKNRFMVKEHDGFTYFIRIDEILKVSETTPIDHVKEEIKKIILHRRKIQLLDRNRDKLFDAVIQNNQAELSI